MERHGQQVASRSITLRHGHVFTPPSRAYLAWQAGEIDEGALNQRESGKFFPHSAGGQPDPFAKDDVVNALPPPDGKIASANQATGALLDQPGDHWTKHEVRSGERLDISWYFSANHVTRRWNYFITRPGWDSAQVLSRDQFEAEPFHTVQIDLQPFWQHGEAMEPVSPTTHEVTLPEREGYHVLLAVWEVANSPNAFYHVVDLQFEAGQGVERPSTPAGLTADEVSDSRVTLSWQPSSGPQPIERYRLIRNGTDTFEVPASATRWHDSTVVADATYHYSIIAIDVEGAASLPATPIVVRTLGEGGVPTAPEHLHSMGQTTDSSSLMWGASTGASPIKHYQIYRDTKLVVRTAGDQTQYTDRGLQPDTAYSYYVEAVDDEGRVSAPSNELLVKTAGESDYPAWQLNQSYTLGGLVSHVGATWRCLQSHTAYAEDWAPGLPTSETLWANHP